VSRESGAIQLLIANDGIKVVFGESMGLDVPTQEFMKQLL